MINTYKNSILFRINFYTFLLFLKDFYVYYNKHKVVMKTIAPIYSCFENIPFDSLLLILKTLSFI